MDRITLYSHGAPDARPLKARPFASEADLRRFAERRLEPALGLQLVATEGPIDG